MVVRGIHTRGPTKQRVFDETARRNVRDVVNLRTSKSDACRKKKYKCRLSSWVLFSSLV